MKRIILIALLALCLGWAIEYSLRIKSLGTDFAHLIPDYETDLYNNPRSIGTSLVGVRFDPYASMPLTGIALSKRFGWYGKYWGSSIFELRDRSYGWESNTGFRIDFEDLWMLDMRGHIWKIFEDVWHLYNDGYYKSQEYENSNNLSSREQNLAYFLKVQGEQHKFTENLALHGMAGGAYYWKRTQENEINLLDQHFLILSFRFKLFYRNAPTPNKFTSWFIDIGGPRSTEEIDALPYSIYLRAPDDEFGLQPVFSANALITSMAWAKGYPLEENGFFAIGIRDDLLYQNMEHAQADSIMIFLRNKLSIPLAVEYIINRVSVRFGTVFYSEYKNNKKENDEIIFRQTISHSLNYNYSFGLGWEPVDRFNIDLHYHSHGWDFGPKDWEIYLKYFL